MEFNVGDEVYRLRDKQLRRLYVAGPCRCGSDCGKLRLVDSRRKIKTQKECETAFPVELARTCPVRPGCPEHVRLWDSINKLVEASGGRNEVSYPRMTAVVEVERSLESLINAAKAWRTE